MSIDPADLLAQARAAGLKIATAESCTGGMVSARLIDIPGSSDVVERGFVVYSNDAKVELLGVPRNLIREHGAVSEEVARAMAEGAIAHSYADITVGITGIAGPGSISESKPAGLVHLAASRKGGETIHRECRFGDIGRYEVREASADVALELMQSLI